MNYEDPMIKAETTVSRKNRMQHVSEPETLLGEALKVV
jgi:hypothetical protein